MRFIFLAFGQDLTIYYQVCFCVLSLLRKPYTQRITVLTDHPALFRYFAGKIEVERLSNEKLEKWKGPADFFWRIKIKAIMEMINRFPGEHIVFLDADTFLVDGFQELNSKLDQGIPIMHENEGKLSRKGGRYKSMWAAFRGKTICGIKIDSATEVWNSGVVGIPGQQSSTTIQLALDLCDEFCTMKVRRGFLEQFIVGLALRHVYGPIFPANRWIGHYWGTKFQWNNIIMSFFTQSILEKRTFEQDLAAMKAFDFSAPPLRMMKQRKWVKKLQRLLTKKFPLKTQKYHPSSKMS